jgi:5-methylthioribose kinase
VKRVYTCHVQTDAHEKIPTVWYFDDVLIEHVFFYLAMCDNQMATLLIDGSNLVHVFTLIGVDGPNTLLKRNIEPWTKIGCEGWSTAICGVQCYPLVI